MNIKSVMEVVQATTLPDNPNEFDLRFFTKITLGDSYDGRSGPMGGVGYSAILYGVTVVYQRSKYRDEYDMSPGARTEGRQMYQDLYDVSQLYLRILRICRAKFFEGRPDESDQELRSSDHWDCVLLDEKVRAILTDHPQYRALCEDFGLTLEKTHDPVGWIRVNASKRYVSVGFVRETLLH